ncbi:MAG: methyltransferase domain-containing protein [Gemmatimonadetes bacterium]|nr:methyltransferase domain-containing protein [Gemmatimonadota bacterium]NNM04785.1 methyltransferase domain-containing protein [Gemmatimonadota bacterium]
MSDQPFDEHAAEYDSWFLQNRNVLQSEVELLAGALQNPGRTLSVGCGSGLFEMILRESHDIDVHFGIEPAEGMAEIAMKRGMEVKIGSAEALPFDDGSFDTVLFNGTPSYITGLKKAFQEASRVLRDGGHVVVADVPAESSYGTLYRLAAMVGTWDDESLKVIAPAVPYPMEFAAAANWRTTQEKLDLLEEVGFSIVDTSQTLTLHPKFSNDTSESPVPGYDRGDYVAVRARK